MTVRRTPTATARVGREGSEETLRPCIYTASSYWASPRPIGLGHINLDGPYKRPASENGRIFPGGPCLG